MVFRVIGVIWAILAFLIFMEYADDLAQVKWYDWLPAAIILILGAPIFTLNNILTFLLDLFMPEGWEDDN